MVSHDVIATAVGAAEIIDPKRLNKLRHDVAGASYFLESPPDVWAVFVIPGKNLAQVEIEGIKGAQRLKIRPLLVAQNYDAIKAIAPHYSTLCPHILYEIAGEPELLAAPADLPKIKKRPRTATRPRVDSRLLEGLTKHKSLPRPLRERIASLSRKYVKIKAKPVSDRDSMEEAALIDFAIATLTQMGLKSDRIKATQLIRTLEGAGLGGGRDHFFHSFQNYFLGLHAIAECTECFRAYKEIARIHWEIDPTQVWFLEAMWHDVGYGAQNFETVTELAYPEGVIEHQSVRQSFLDRTEVQEGTHVLSSLTARLLSHAAPATEWMEPSMKAALGQEALNIKAVYQANFLGRSHGAYGALRLYCDYSDDVNCMEPDSRERLRQTMLLAAASMPFHDWWFRTQLRQHGRFQIRPSAMPFAALLMFVDSIQDDRRDLEGGDDPVQVLKGLVCYDKSLVVAEINQGALRNFDLLQKIVEARDVSASMLQSANGLQFKYPSWLVPSPAD